jgi:carbon storage regulator
MLVLNRKLGEKVFIGNDIVVTVIDVRGDRVRLGFDCPSEIPVHREEVYRRIRAERPACVPVVPLESRYYVECA